MQSNVTTTNSSRNPVSTQSSKKNNNSKSMQSTYRRISSENVGSIKETSSIPWVLADTPPAVAVAAAVTGWLAGDNREAEKSRPLAFGNKQTNKHTFNYYLNKNLNNKYKQNNIREKKEKNKRKCMYNTYTRIRICKNENTKRKHEVYIEARSNNNNNKKYGNP